MILAILDQLSNFKRRYSPLTSNAEKCYQLSRRTKKTARITNNNKQIICYNPYVFNCHRTNR